MLTMKRITIEQEETNGPGPDSSNDFLLLMLICCCSEDDEEITLLLRMLLLLADAIVTVEGTLKVVSEREFED
jgi:hypothetical protein